MNSKKTRALVLFSGGLDSLLAARVLEKVGCEVVALTFTSPFFGSERAERGAKNLEIKIIVEDISSPHFQLLRDPPHGFGKNLNPCLDCHALMFSLAKKIAQKEGCAIIATGEVLGQRPFSQNRDALRLVEKISGVGVLRPLSARLLPETAYEKAGLVERSKLLDLHGKSRKPQLALATEFKITDFPAPAGGCLLTDPGFAARLKILLARDSTATPVDAELLKVGRFFPLGEKSFALIGRNFAENEKLYALASPQIYLAKMSGFVGPTALIKIKKPDFFTKIFPAVAEKIRDYGRDSKKFSGQISFKIWGKLEKEITIP